MQIRDIVAAKLGASVAEEEYPDATDADSAAKVLVRRNPARLALIVINLSANTVVIAPDRDVSTTRGIQISANGGSVTLNVNDDFTLPSLEWWVVASVDNSAIYVLALNIQPEQPGAVQR